MRGPITRWMLVGTLILSGKAATGVAAMDVTPDGFPAAPVATEHRYRLSAAIRPLLFWVGAGDVGDARLVWRANRDGCAGYELLLGSDPARAPRRINRWGWAREDADASGATMLGIMSRSEDESLEQAQARLQREGTNGYSFKLIRARVERGEARAESTTVLAPRDYDYRQLAELRRFVEQAPPLPRVRTGRLPPGTHPGLLFALAELVRAGVAAARGDGAAQPQPRSVQFTFNAGVYDLGISSWKRVERTRYGGREYRRLVRLELESRNRERDTRERFVLECGIEGELAEVPVFMRYQPKWWFKVEGVLDETEPVKPASPSDLSRVEQPKAVGPTGSPKPR